MDYIFRMNSGLGSNTFKHKRKYSKIIFKYEIPYILSEKHLTAILSCQTVFYVYEYIPRI